jgi:hypothetical protein
MRLEIKTDGVQFQVGAAPQPKKDYKDKTKQATTRDGQKIWIVKLGAQDDYSLEVLWVEMVGDEPKVTPGQAVQVRGLVFAPLVTRENKIWRRFRAEAVEPLASGKPSVHAA